MCIYLVFGCTLIIRSRRLGIYLTELAVLYSLVGSTWITFKTAHYLLFGDDVLFADPEAIAIVQTLSWVFIAAAHVAYLWCLRNEKSIKYFKLKR